MRCRVGKLEATGHRKAAGCCAQQFRRAGLVPAGEAESYQPVPMRAIRFNPERSSAALIRANGDVRTLRWQRQIGNLPREGAPTTIDAPLGFTGCGVSQRSGRSGQVLGGADAAAFRAWAARIRADAPAGYTGTLVIDPGTGPEPVRWPFFSSTVMWLRGAAEFAAGTRSADGPPVQSRGCGRTASRFRSYVPRAAHLGGCRPAPTHLSTCRPPACTPGIHFVRRNLGQRSRGVARFGSRVGQRAYVVVSAHLDGYGVGEAVNRDRIYNGALDDAAFVATLIHVAQQLNESGRRFKRSVLFAAFTAEERGMLGSGSFVAHPTVPKAQLVANINLDTLRPIFPLTSLTTLGLDDSTLGDVAREIGGAMGIRIKADMEPDRILVQRSDQWSFIQAQIPAIAFVFGYEPGSKEETIYRRWYAERYHSPSDDVNQPWDPEAAARFNSFFQRLLEAVADAPRRPTFKSASAGR